MSSDNSSRKFFGPLEIVLVLAIVALFFQVFPALWWAFLASLDPRTWSRGTWFALNLAVLGVLFGLRFGPDLYADWRKRRDRLANERKRNRPTTPEASMEHDADYEARANRDADWRERASKRLPWHQ